MNFEWDNAKSETTRLARGFGFEIVRDVDWDYAVLREVQWVEGEERELWYGPTPRRLYAIVLTERSGKHRVISIRTAKQHEIHEWRREVGQG